MTPCRSTRLIVCSNRRRLPYTTPSPATRIHHFRRGDHCSKQSRI